jgi:6-pyruvoyltetrahydropterin/6-carboxytetrahydropterin synthase
MKICRRESFNAAHRLHNPEWNDEKNLEVFGKCSNPNYHGHNYTLDVWIEGEIDPITGMVINLKTVKDIIKKFILDEFDHRNLNLDCNAFKNLNPTAENIAFVIWGILREQFDEKYQITVDLFETEKNKVSYSGK